MGPDNLPYKVFKNENLIKLYDYILETGVIPLYSKQQSLNLY